MPPAARETSYANERPINSDTLSTLISVDVRSTFNCVTVDQPNWKQATSDQDVRGYPLLSAWTSYRNKVAEGIP